MLDKLENKNPMPSSDCLAIWIRFSNLLRTSKIFFLITTSIGCLGFLSSRLPSSSKNCSLQIEVLIKNNLKHQYIYIYIQ